MTLVERFIEIQGWSTSRKVALSATYLAGLTVMVLVVGVFLLPSTYVDMDFYWQVNLLTLAISVIMAV
ncbi:MAG TPA: hypothetical protein VLI04_15615, partial [Nocardioidaceae bacterium]|nr:hypothetical protein [Nocardioidaceae bacterium]